MIPTIDLALQAMLCIIANFETEIMKRQFNILVIDDEAEMATQEAWQAHFIFLQKEDGTYRKLKDRWETPDCNNRVGVCLPRPNLNFFTPINISEL